MMPHNYAWQRLALIVSLCGATISGGCTAPLFRGQSPETKEIAELVDERADQPRFVGDLAAPVGTADLRVHGVALVTNLDGTGSDPPPSPLRDQLKKEMQTHNVRRPDEALASKNTAMVLVSGSIPPGAQKGDVFDIAVRVAPRTETTNLRGGWLMATRLREMSVLDHTIHTGHVAALSQGPILCDAQFDKSQDTVLQLRGRVLGGGVVQLERPLGLVIRDEHTSIKTSTMIGAAINDRFHDFDRGTKRGLANPTRDNYVELKVHSRYRDNVPRFIQVVRNITVGESPVECLARLSELQKQLLEPTSSQRAALQLEAIGTEGVPILRKAITSSDPEIRFYAAEALAYLDDSDATDALSEAARNERAFRWRAMLALAVMDQYASQQALVELMNASSAETRYGAFRALRAHDARDPLVRGEILNDEFALHMVSTTGDAMIHISRSKRPEIVIFGERQKLEAPSFVFAGKRILIKRHNEQTVKVSCFGLNGEDQQQVCSTDLSDVIRTIAKLGGGYADVIQALEEAKSKGFLAARLEVDALPRGGRLYHREDHKDSAHDDSTELESTQIVPDIFLDRLKRDDEKPETSSVDEDLEITEGQVEPRGWLDRMTAWMVE